jgi:hypothetical protein
LLTHTPVGDPLGWSLRNQLERLRSGRVAPEAFDYGYLRFYLGRAGYEALERLEREAEPGSPARERVQLALQAPSYWRWQQAKGSREPERFARVPRDAPWPAGLQKTLATSDDYRLQQCGSEARCLVLDRDLDEDGRDESIVAVGDKFRIDLFVFASDEGGKAWRLRGRLRPTQCCPPFADQMDLLREGRLELVAPSERDVRIGGARYRLVGPD